MSLLFFPSKVEPAGFKLDKSFALQNYPAAGGVSASGSAYVNRGELLFKFYSFHDDVRLRIRLTDSGRVPRLLDEDYAFPVERNGGAHFVLCTDFPEAYTRDNVYCYFELTLANETPGREQEGTAVNVQMMYRP
jgi:hypothetical protein